MATLEGWLYPSDNVLRPAADCHPEVSELAEVLFTHHTDGQWEFLAPEEQNRWIEVAYCTRRAMMQHLERAR